MTRKFLCALFLVALISSTCFAAESKIDAGILTYLGTTEAEFQNGLDDLRKALAPFMPQGGNEYIDDAEKFENWIDDDMLGSFVSSLIQTRRVIHFYDSLLSMQMALRSGKVDEIALPEPVGLYLISNNSRYDVMFSLNMMPSTISFGFKRGNVNLQKEFNNAISAMKKDGTLTKLKTQYIDEFSENISPAKFQTFKDAQTIKVAVTGDLPPIDYIASNGMPTGYNTAILAEIGKRLKKNIRLISIDTGGRSSALASERADVVFWYRNTEGIKAPEKLKDKNLKNVMKDSLEGIILSEPYYEWDVDLIIGRTGS